MAAGPSTLMPTLRYRDAPAAIAWLCNAFGFTQRQVYAGSVSGTIEHAELEFGGGMVMLGSVRDTDSSRMMRHPDEAGGVTQGIYVVVADINAHYRRAKAADAEIVMEIMEQPYGRFYSCRDPEGHIWSFGDYDPWKAPPQF
jgi:uncharacterized glyoxalase superfamily protein PhnB